MGAVAAETTVAWNDHSGPLVTRSKGYDIIACAVCGFRHVVPLPDPREIERAHRESSYLYENTAFFQGSDEDRSWMELAYKDRLDLFEHHLSRGQRRLLDVGAGTGLFLKTAKDRDWRVMGIEPSKRASAEAREKGLEVVEGVFNADTAPGLGRFDVVHLNNVLEHAPDPILLVNLVRDMLTPGGLLCLNAPNDFSPFQAAARASGNLGEWWVAPPRHLNYFDFDSLTRLVEHHGFSVADRTTSFPMEMFLLMGLDYTKDPALGRACHTQRKRFDLALENSGLRDTRRAFYRALAEAGIGREAVVIAIKNKE